VIPMDIFTSKTKR